MPRLEPKAVQKELEQGQLWPVYWLFGAERMKSRELLKRIRRTVLGEETEGNSSLAQFAEETLDGNEVSGAEVRDSAQSPSLGGGTRFIVVRDAHAIKDTELLADLLGPRSAKRDELTSVCVFLSKDLDARRKFSKQLIEQSAVVPCEEVPESEREAWIGYLAKRRGVNLPPGAVIQLGTLDPWSLDIVDQELEKYALAEGEGGEVLLAGGEVGGTEAFLDAFFRRDLANALARVAGFADRPDESLPLLGLLAWNVRQLALSYAPAGAPKLNPYVAEKLRRWSAQWKLTDVIRLQARLSELDFGMKQTPLLPLGLWTSLVTEFCRETAH